MKRMVLWLGVMLVGAGFYVVFEGDWKKALGLIVGSIIIDIAIDEGLLEFEKKRGKVD